MRLPLPRGHLFDCTRATAMRCSHCCPSCSPSLPISRTLTAAARSALCRCPAARAEPGLTGCTEFAGWAVCVESVAAQTDQVGAALTKLAKIIKAAPSDSQKLRKASSMLSKLLSGESIRECHGRAIVEVLKRLCSKSGCQPYLSQVLQQTIQR